MISDVILSTSNLSSAERFYDGFLALFGAQKTIQNDSRILWKCRNENVGLILCEANKKLTSQKICSLTVALQATSPAEVRMIHQVAIRLGATCAGKPTVSEAGEHEAYFWDADQNKFGIFYHQ
ncbi:MAG: hypothetical protein MJK12_01335 [Colwellia sp.]|nr:hypothetical protein [Colwellia sp.]